jgi:lysophospholipase L1-like esterase
MKRVPLLGAAVAGVIALVACDLIKNPTDPTPPVPANTVNYTAIGASDTTGYGSTVVCLPFTECPDGTGYVQTIGRQLKTDGKTVTLVNLGLPGAVLSPQTEALGNSLGRGIVGNFIERELPFVPKNTTLVTIFAGGNDANTIGAAIEAGVTPGDPTTYIQSQAENFGKDFRTLISGITSRAPNARIVILNLPNLAGLPYAAGYTLPEKQGLQQLSVAFSAQINSLSAQGALIVDLMCDARSYIAGFYSSDGFHPNDQGYAYLAETSYPAVSTGATPKPPANCSHMTKF